MGQSKQRLKAAEIRAESDFPRYLGLLLAALLGLILPAVLGCYFFLVFQPATRHDALIQWNSRLSHDAGTLSSVIEQWVRERRADASVIASFPTVREIVRNGRRGGKKRTLPQEEHHISDILTEMAGKYGYRGIYILGGQGEILAGSAGTTQLDAATNSLVRKAFNTGFSQVSLHAWRESGVPTFTLVQPIEDSGKGIAGAVLTTVDARRWLYRILAPDESMAGPAEILLVQPSGGGGVTFLSPLLPPLTRPFLTLNRVKPSSVEHAAAQAKEEIGAFTDYRGVPVLAATRPLKGTPWTLLVKVDRAGALAAYHVDIRRHALFLLALYLVSVLAGIAVWKHLRAAYYRNMQRRNAYLATVLSTGSEGIWQLDESYVTSYVNPALADMMGFAVSEMEGRPLFDFLEPDVQREAEGYLAQRREGRQETHPFRFRRKDGSPLWAMVSASGLFDEKGRFEGVIAMVTDIGPLKEAEERLVRFNALLRTISEINQVSLRTDSTEALFNEACGRLVSTGGMRMAWIAVPTPVSGRLVPLAQAGFEEGYLKQIHIRADESPLGMGPTGKAFRIGKSVVCQDTLIDESFAPWRSQAVERGYRSSGAFPILLHGKVEGVLNVYHFLPGFFETDVQRLVEELAADLGFALHSYTLKSDMEGTMARLKHSENRYRALFENANDGIFLARQGRIVECNAKALELFGYSRDDFIGRHPAEVSPDQQPGGRDSWTAAELHIREALLGHPQYFTWLHQKADGTPFEVEVTLNRIDLGEDTVLQAILRDVTEHRVMEDQLRQAQKIEAIGQLAGGVAHDFNNLLMAIQGPLELLQTKLPEDSPLQKDLAGIRHTTVRAAELTRQLLAFARRQIISPESLDINQLIGDLSPLLRRLLPENVDLHVEPCGEGGAILVDRIQFEQILINLCINAKDAMPEGGRLLIETERATVGPEYLASHPWAHPGEYCLLTVTDTGSGMDRETQEHIFEPFFTTKKLGHGTGLGLASVYGIVKQHEGMIHVYSEPEKGTSFKIYFPLSGSTAQAVPPRESDIPHGEGESILVVEDEEVVRTTVVEILQSLGYMVREASDGKQALEKLDQGGPVDLVVTDLVMPMMGGEEMSREIESRHPGTRFLFISGYSEKSLDGAFLNGKEASFIAKPFGMAGLARKVRELLEPPDPAKL
ncbi:MAG: PAS domain S-box protein [Acidobacteriota bacterium]